MTTLTQIAETPGRGSKRQMLVSGSRSVEHRFYSLAFDSSYPAGGESISTVFDDFRSVIQIVPSPMGTILPTIDYTNKKMKLHTAISKDEVQTLSLSAGIAAETFKLTFNGHASANVTLPTGGYANVTAAQIKAALITISDWTTNSADIQVVKSTNDYIITFVSALGSTDIGAITVTNKVGAADGSVAETVKGVNGEVVDTTSEATITVVFEAIGYTA